MSCARLDTVPIYEGLDFGTFVLGLSARAGMSSDLLGSGFKRVVNFGPGFSSGTEDFL